MVPAPFEVATESADGVRIFAIKGELDLDTAPGLSEPLDSVVNENDSFVLIDLSDCEFIDSTGVALLVRAWQRLDHQAGNGGKGRLVLCCPGQQVRRLLEITGVESSISMHQGRDEAIAELTA